MREYLDGWHATIDNLSAAGKVHAGDSFGFAMAEPLLEGDPDDALCSWNNPKEYVWFVGGWGPERNRYVANAIRKLRPLLRHDEAFSTLELRLNGETGAFRDPVESASVDPGKFLWGDFPYGGAVIRDMGVLMMVGACSGFTELEDDMVTGMILADLAGHIINANMMLPH